MLAATLLRLCLPSWAFFDRVGHPPLLEVRAPAAEGDASGWRPAFAAPRRRWWHLLWAPDATRTLLLQTLVERAQAETDEATPAVRTTRRQLGAVAAAAARAIDPADDRRWQWRVVERAGAAPARSRTVLAATPRVVEAIRP